MTCQNYSKGIMAQNNSSDVIESLTEFEKALCAKLTRIEIIGKRGRIVPVILTAKMKQSVDMLLQYRERINVSSSNNFIFAIANSDGHMRGSDTLRKLSMETPLKKPLLLRSTKLQKQIATLSQLVNLSENEQDVLAQFMGHDLKTHRDYYRLPSGTIQVSKVAKLLLQLESGTVPTAETFQNMTSNDLGFTPDENPSDEGVPDGKYNLNY